MNNYKVSFANNQVINSQLSNQRFDHDSEYFYEYMGQVLYAQVCANNEEEAKANAKKLISTIIRSNDKHIDSRMSAAA